MLEELCSCEIAHTSHPGLFIFAALAVIGGIASQQYYGVLIGLAIALILVLAYLLTRKAVLSLASANAVIKHEAIFHADTSAPRRVKILPLSFWRKPESRHALIPALWILLQLKDWNDGFTFELYFRRE